MPDGPDGLSDSGLAAAMAAVSMRDAVAGKLVYQDKAAAGGKLSEPVIEVTMRRALTGKLFFQDDKVPSGLTVGELADRFSRKVAMRLFIGNNIHGEESLPPDAVLANVARVAGAQDGLHLHAVFDTGHLQAIFNPGADGRPVRSDDQATLEDLNQRFLVLAKVGSGTFSNVYKALRQDTDPEKLVAIKKLEIDEEEGGIPAAQIREVSLVKQLDHPHIVKMMDIATTSNALLLVFELLDMDLRAFMRGNPDYFTGRSQLWSAVHQCSIGLHHCHVQRIIHRDLKPQNVLVDVGTMTLKLADFGLARSFSVPARAYTPEVVTLWYRAPELLLGQTSCTTSLDIWSLACVIAEMATNQPLFPGDSEIDTLFKIFQLLGTPTEKTWQGVTQLQHFQACFPQWEDTMLVKVAKQGPALMDDGIDLLKGCLRYSPKERLSSRRILLHPFFKKGVPACPDNMEHAGDPVKPSGLLSPP
jgi:cyclin-dependent kinase 2